MTGCLTRNSITVLLLCSQIGLDLESNSIKPFTVRQWVEFSEKLANSSIKNPETLLETKEEDWKVHLNIEIEEANRINTLLSRTAQLEEELAQLQRMGICLTTTAEKNYPEKLKARLGMESPPVLYYSGNLDILQHTTIAVFGSADWDKASMRFAKELADKCAKQGVVVLTGGGTAADSTIEARALESGGKAAGFLTYDYMQKLKQDKAQAAISSGSFLLLSAAHPEAPLTLRSSMEKNKYIYGLADYAVVVSAEDRNGITYNGAVENLRRQSIPLFVRKDVNMSDGNGALIEQGAHPLTVDEIPIFVDGLGSYVL